MGFLMRLFVEGEDLGVENVFAMFMFLVPGSLYLAAYWSMERKPGASVLITRIAAGLLSAGILTNSAIAVLTNGYVEPLAVLFASVVIGAAATNAILAGLESGHRVFSSAWGLGLQSTVFENRIAIYSALKYGLFFYFIFSLGSWFGGVKS
ncbi:MAG: hypothetical protein DHS20C11_05740 [Lysobacteraceae bacterium]|nr:MAG: hypothetical protein DHS20C11_05740 [Xanthomonadaceae bacterium]